MAVASWTEDLRHSRFDAASVLPLNCDADSNSFLHYGEKGAGDRADADTSEHQASTIEDESGQGNEIDNESQHAGLHREADLQESDARIKEEFLKEETAVSEPGSSAEQGKGKKRGGREQGADEKTKSLHTKCLQQVAALSSLEREVLALRRKCEQANKEKDTLNAEVRRENGVKQKLEALCRELQRQNKTVLDDSKRMAMEESQKRHELSTKFHNTIKEITTKLDEQGEDRMRQVKENEALREKLKHFSQHYELREQHFLHQLRTKVLEQQLLDAKLKQQQELTVQEEAKAKLYHEQFNQLLQTEGELRQQLAMYGEKFEQFQDTLTKSNEVFASFKKEMEKMSKTIKKLEKENAELKKNSTDTKVKLIEMLDEKTSLQKQLETAKLQKEKLEALCRSLQNERKAALAAKASATPAASTELQQQQPSPAQATPMQEPQDAKR